MDCTSFWTRGERPFISTCALRSDVPSLNARTRIIDEETKCSPPDSTATGDMEWDDYDWESHSPTASNPDREPSQGIKDPVDDAPASEYREHGSANTAGVPQVLGNPPDEPKHSEFKKTRRVHFSPTLFYESFELEANGEHPDKMTETAEVSNFSDHHEIGCMFHNPVDGVASTNSKFGRELGLGFNFPRPRCGRSSNYEYSKDYLHSGPSGNALKLDIEQFVCNLSVRPTPKLPAPLPESPNLTGIGNFHPQPHARLHLAETPPGNLRFCSMETQTEVLEIATQRPENPLSLGSHVTACPTTKADFPDLHRKWKIFMEPKPSLPLTQNFPPPEDIDGASTSLRNCVGLLRDRVSTQAPSSTITLKSGKPKNAPHGLRISSSHAIDNLDHERAADIPETTNRSDVGVVPSQVDARRATQASMFSYESHKEAGGTDPDSTPRAALPAAKYTKGGNKASKSSYQFDMPSSTDADFVSGRLKGYRVTTPGSRSNKTSKSPWFDVTSSTDADFSAGVLQGGGFTPPGSKSNETWKSSYWFDVPYSTEADHPVGFSPRTELATLDSELVETSKSSFWFDVPSSETDPARSASAGSGLFHWRFVPPHSEPLETSRSSYCLDAPYSKDADVPARAWLQRKVARRGIIADAEPVKPSKSSYWFDVPYKTDADLPAGLLQRLLQRGIGTQSSEVVVDIDSTERSSGLSGGVDAVDTAHPLKSKRSSPRPFEARPRRGHGAIFKTSPIEKVYPGEFCPSFRLSPGDIMMTRNLRTEQIFSKIGGHVTLFPDPRYFVENGIEAADYYQFTLFDMVLRFGQFDNHDDWNWVPSPSFSLFMYAPPERCQSASWWLVELQPSVALSAPDHSLDRVAASLPLNSRLELVVRNTDLVISTIPDPRLSPKKRWKAQWGSSLFLPVPQDVLVRACYGLDSSASPTFKTTLVTVELYSFYGGSVAKWRFLGRDEFCYGLHCPPNESSYSLDF